MTITMMGQRRAAALFVRVPVMGLRVTMMFMGCLCIVKGGMGKVTIVEEMLDHFHRLAPAWKQEQGQKQRKQFEVESTNGLKHKR